MSKYRSARRNRASFFLRAPRSAGRSLPARYEEDWRSIFYSRVTEALAPNARILDVGPGGSPVVPPASRPPGCFYAALDVSSAELAKASAGSYDEVWVADVAMKLPELQHSFDLIVSWQVLEHVKPLGDALRNLHAYLRNGGILVAHLSGGRSVFAVLNRALPQRVGRWLLTTLLGRDPKTVFPAYYDGCTYTGLRRLLDGWNASSVTPRYRGASYLAFSPILQRVYLAYEDWLVRSMKADYATHYLVTARK